MFRDFVRKVKNGEGGFYGTLKKTILFFLNFHIPLFWPLSWIYKGLYYFHIFIKEATVILLEIIYFQPMFRTRCSKVGNNLRMEKLPYVIGEGRIIIGTNVNISGRISIGFNDRVAGTPELIIGDKVFLGHGSSYAIAQKIEIGDRCFISSGVKISDNDGHPIDSVARGEHEAVGNAGIRPVKLCNDVWIGANALILKGVTLGEKSIVGAGAVVTKDVPPSCVVAGNPAVVVRHLT